MNSRYNTRYATSRQIAAIGTLIEEISYSRRVPTGVTFKVYLEHDNLSMLSFLNGLVRFNVVVNGIVRQTYFISQRGNVRLHYSQYINTPFVTEDFK